ncbi:hypothetical protein DFP78_10848 [Photobacterium lutimaris]|nr:hypothetical protein DFP78_10848 [Photobacterium lutimaris]
MTLLYPEEVSGRLGYVIPTFRQRGERVFFLLQTLRWAVGLPAVAEPSNVYVMHG